MKNQHSFISQKLVLSNRKHELDLSRMDYIRGCPPSMPSRMDGISFIHHLNKFFDIWGLFWIISVNHSGFSRNFISVLITEPYLMEIEMAKFFRRQETDHVSHATFHHGECVICKLHARANDWCGVKVMVPPVLYQHPCRLSFFIR